MRVAITEELMPLSEAPCGLLQMGECGYLLFKTEYRSDDGTCMTYVVESGESCSAKNTDLVRAIALI